MLPRAGLRAIGPPVETVVPWLIVALAMFLAVPRHVFIALFLGKITEQFPKALRLSVQGRQSRIHGFGLLQHTSPFNGTVSH